MARDHVSEGVGPALDLIANLPERVRRRKHTVTRIVRVGGNPVCKAVVVEVVEQLVALEREHAGGSDAPQVMRVR